MRAVMDAAGSERAVIYGISEGGAMSALFAAMYPHRTIGLILYGAFPRVLDAPDWPGIPREMWDAGIEHSVAHFGEGSPLEHTNRTRWDNSVPRRAAGYQAHLAARLLSGRCSGCKSLAGATPLRAVHLRLAAAAMIPLSNRWVVAGGPVLQHLDVLADPGHGHGAGRAVPRRRAVASSGQMARMEVEVRKACPASEAAAPLIAELDAEIQGRYSEPLSLDLAIEAEEVEDGRGVFALAWAAGGAVGCGAVDRTRHSGAEADVRGPRVPPTRRREGVAAVLGE